MARLTKKQRMAISEAIDLEDWFEQIRSAGGPEEEKGACLIKNPNTGQDYCIQTTREQCKALKGFWAAGPCGV